MTWMRTLSDWLRGTERPAAVETVALPEPPAEPKKDPAPSPAEVAARVRPRTNRAPRRPAPPVFDTDPGKPPTPDPMLWSVIEPINPQRRRPYEPEEEA